MHICVYTKVQEATLPRLRQSFEIQILVPTFSIDLLVNLGEFYLFVTEVITCGIEYWHQIILCALKLMNEKWLA